jgi:5-methylcytosine-specific restriction endonuclease McrA
MSTGPRPFRGGNPGKRLSGRALQAARERVWKASAGLCAACGHQCDLSADALSGFHLDHKARLEDGGHHGDENLQVLCVPCHKTKSAAERRQRTPEVVVWRDGKRVVVVGVAAELMSYRPKRRHRRQGG